MQVDYIIVGAGSAGCILAEQLTRCGRFNVLLLEAGGGLHNPWISVPAGFGATYYHPKYNYMYYSDNEATMADRQLYVPRGKGLGGSGSINAMIYVRGAPRDFDDWAKAGNPQWSYSKVLPYFQALEQHPDNQAPLRGKQGPIGITPMALGAHPICQNFLQATQQLGLPQSPDFNGDQFAGAGIYDTNIRGGRRDSSYTAYLKPALKRTNLGLWLEAQVEKLILKDKQVNGVQVIHQGKRQQIKAKREVILCAGAVASPQILQMSGIGDPAHLQSIGIDCQHPLTAVGENLQDHLCASFYFRSNCKTLNDEFGTWRGKLKAAWQYAMARKGPLSMSVNQAGGFFRGAEEEEHANIQLYFNPLSYEIPENPNAKLEPLPYSGFLIAANPCRPTSQGQIRISSPNPNAAPSIKLNFLATQRDQREAIQGGNLVRKIASAPALKAITISEDKPAALASNDAQMLNYFRTHGGSIYHLSGTCNMGPDPAQSVVDENLKVHGIEGLRIADASIFPNITSGNTNAPTMMVALKGAELILAYADQSRPKPTKADKSRQELTRVNKKTKLTPMLATAQQ